jgi:glycosyltransferase involved in cell wall biosynthesis
MRRKPSAGGPGDESRELLLVSIGLPVRNAVNSVEAAIISALGQEYENLELVIADNASTDGTSDICREWATKDPRVRLVSQPTDVGAVANFRTVLIEADGDFFAWLGADDVMEPTFLDTVMNQLRDNPAIVGCSGLVAWVDGTRAPGSFAITGSPRARVACFLRHARDNSRFYGVFRREVLLRWFPAEDFYAFDIAVMAGTLTEGDHGCIDEVLLHRVRSDPRAYVGVRPLSSGPWIDRALPLLPMTRFLGKRIRLLRSPSILWWLILRNLYESYKLAVYHSRVSRPLRHIDSWIERIRLHIVTRM